MRVLLVEDEPKLAEPLLALLARERYDAVWAEDIPAARSAFAACERDLAVLDVMLPGDEDAGFTLASELCQAGYRGHSSSSLRGTLSRIVCGASMTVAMTTLSSHSVCWSFSRGCEL